MKQQLAAGATIFVAWTILDVLAHRLVFAGLYESSPGGLWRPASEMSALLVTGVTFVLIAVFVAMYQGLVRPKSVAAGLRLGGLLGVALGVSAGFGTYIHLPIPLALAVGWCVHGVLKGLVAGVVLGAWMHDDRRS
jgi:hypothetical protein